MSLLDKDDIAALGIKGGWVLGLKDFVRYGDLDSYNHVNNKVYHAWFENIRILYMQGLGQVFDGDAAIKPVLRTAFIEYHAQMLLDQSYITLCRASSLGRTSFQLDYAVWSNGVYPATGHTAIVMVDNAATQSMPIPDDIRTVLIDRDGAVER